MSISNLFKHIRHEDVIIWAGAGLSRYAGYPLGNDLKNILLDNLSEEDRLQVDSNAYLDVVAEEFVRLKNGSRNELVRILKEVFDREPKDRSNHKKLSDIPHIKTYITTNYDTLIESTIGKDTNTIARNADVAFWDDTKRNILKIHGDLRYPETIILTKSDYAKFYRLDRSSPLWSVITEKIATKVVVFLGYGYEDPNIWAIFDQVADHIGAHRREAYFIGRNLPPHRIAFLAKHGIEYIESSVESFIDDLIADIRTNIIEDFLRQKVSPESFRKFLNLHQLQPVLNGTKTGFSMDSLSGLHGSPVSCTMEITGPDQQMLADKIKDFYENAGTERIELNEDVLENVAYEIEGINMQHRDMKIGQISFIKHPSVIYEFDLVFFQQDFELNNLKAKVYRGERGSVLKMKVYGLEVKLALASQNGTIVKLNLNYDHPGNFASVNEALAAYNFLKHLFSGHQFTVLFKDGGSRFSQSAEPDEKKVRSAQVFIDYLERLKKIEKFFQVRFADFGQPTKGYSNLSKFLVKVINNEPVEAASGELSFLHDSAVSQEVLEKYDQLNREDHVVKLTRKWPKEYELHGKMIRIGFQEVLIINAKVINLEELKKGNTRRVLIKSGTGKVEERYLTEVPEGTDVIS